MQSFMIVGSGGAIGAIVPYGAGVARGSPPSGFPSAALAGRCVKRQVLA